MTYKYPLLAFAVALCLPPSAFAASSDPVSMSLETALLFSMNKNPEIGVSAAKLDQTQHAIDEARSSYYPQVRSTIIAGREYNDPTSTPSNDGGASNISSEFTLNVDQTLYDGDKTYEEVQRRTHISNSASLEKRQAYEKVIIDTTKAYMQVYRFQNAKREAEDYIGRLKKIKRKVDLMVMAGAEDQSKLKMAEARLEFAESSLSSLKSSLDTAMITLENITGPLPDFVATKPTLQDLVALDIDEFLKQSEQGNVDLMINHSDLQAIKHELGSAESDFLPNVHLVVDYDETHNSGGEIGRDRAASAMVQVNYKIFDGFGRDATKEKVESKQDQAEFEKARLIRDVRNKVKQAYNKVHALEDEYAIVLAEMKTNGELQDLYLEQFQLGEGDILNLIEGEERLYTSKARVYEIESNITLNILQLAKMCGLIDYGGVCPLCEE
ncbi:MAG: TolC family protein [Pseudobdellovibrionaceae bacterium]